jgi:hypothetical protein
MLSPEQIEARKGKLTASRVAPLMTGDREAILRLYRIMIGEEPEEDLSLVWPVQLGAATEQLQLDWFERKNRTPVSRRGEVAVHQDHPWAACTLDGWANGAPLECKHTGGHEPLEIIIDRYQPQMQWQCWVTGAAECALSVIMGAREPIVEYIDADAAYTNELVRRATVFMACVNTRNPPVALPTVPPPADATKVIDMTGVNEWADLADKWLSSRDAARLNESSAILLKALVPADARRCFGHGIYISRDRANRLSLREGTPT